MIRHALLLAICGASISLASAARAVEPAEVLERYVVIDDVCSWPNLTVLPDGTLVAAIFNRPSHGRMEGDVDCYASRDGRFWNKLSTAAVHDSSANRMNVAAGLAKNGDLLVLTSGWSLTPSDTRGFDLAEVLPGWSCRSDDAGRTWSVERNAYPPAPEGMTNYIPFGDVFVAADGSLRSSAYARQTTPRCYHSWMMRSDDDGRTWQVVSEISADHNETAIFSLGDGHWLAAARKGSAPAGLDLFRSDDDGQSWSKVGPIGEVAQYPGHVMKLADGKLLFTYGNRVAGQFGVRARITADEGATWSEPITLVDDLKDADCGYPASAQLADGAIVTLYYSSGAPSHQRYHTGAVIWKLPVE